MTSPWQGRTGDCRRSAGCVSAATWAWLFCAAALLLPAGCNGTAANVADEQPVEAGAPAAAGADAADVTLRVVGREEYDQLLADYRGKVVLVDIWATWCPPCVEQFPHFVEMAQKFAGREAAFISLSLDEPEDEARVLAFLRQHGATVDNLLSRYGGGTATLDAFEIDESPPIYRVYNRQGELVRVFSHDGTDATRYTHADVERLIDELLAE